MQSMRVAAFQFDVRKGDVAANLSRVEEGLREAARQGIAAVCLPEMWPSSFALEYAQSENDAAVARVQELSGELELVVCGSAYAHAPDWDRPRNRMHVFVGGRPLFDYDKVHLFSPTLERELFTAGEEPPPTVETELGRVSGVLCYDLRFGPLLDVPMAQGAELFFVPAQWPAPRAAHWRSLVEGRAVEGQMLVVAANRCGVETVGRGERGRELVFLGNSLIVDGTGAVLAEGRGEEGLVVAEVDPEPLRRLRRRVPVRDDRRPELYARWQKNVR